MSAADMLDSPFEDGAHEWPVNSSRARKPRRYLYLHTAHSLSTVAARPALDCHAGSFLRLCAIIHKLFIEQFRL
jgi:hypothetical protein